MPSNTVMIMCAHSDDQIFGVGGTMAKYVKQGKKVYTVIFSYGEQSHPWLKKAVTAEIREKESQEADKVVGGSGVTFLGLNEGKFESEAAQKKIVDKLVKMVNRHKPAKLFTHSDDDAHPDHKAVHKLVLDVVDKAKAKPEVYIFDVWTPAAIKNRNRPRLVVDITDTFKLKLKALRCFAVNGPQ